MSINIKRRGQYELFETTRNHQILVLDGNDYYAFVEGKFGPVIVKSDSDHQKDSTISQGDYVLFIAKDDPNWRDNVEHLELQQGEDAYKMFILPNGFPTEQDHQKKLVESDETVSGQKIPK